MKKLILTIALAVVLLAVTSTTAFAEELPGDSLIVPDDIAADQLTDDQLDEELSETIAEIEILVGDDADGIVDELSVDIDAMLDEAEDLLDKAETESKIPATTNDADQKRPKEAQV